ncbi:MAG: hypothetical protein IIA14_06490 [SAR324 cluster bacterium]|nr:hypothetical protein [SAR324 cluster bacterium]
MDLKEAKWEGANLISGGLKGATLREANLKVPKYLTRGQLCSATFNSETVFPDGSTGHMRGGDGRRRSEGQIEKAIRPRWEERQTELLKENPEGGGGGRGLRTIGHHFQRGDAVLEEVSFLLIRNPFHFRRHVVHQLFKAGLVLAAHCLVQNRIEIPSVQCGYQVIHCAHILPLR